MGQGGFPPPSAADPDDWLVSHEDWGSFSPLSPPNPPLLTPAPAEWVALWAPQPGSSICPAPRARETGGCLEGVAQLLGLAIAVRSVRVHHPSSPGPRQQGRGF